MSDISSHHTGLFVLWNLYNKYLEVDVRQLSINLSLIQLACTLARSTFSESEVMSIFTMCL
jgi:hypothetical protein